MAAAKADDNSEVRIENAPIDNQRPPSCCFCLDVRIGAAIIGMMYLIMHAMWLVAASAKLAKKVDIDDQQSADWDYLARFHTDEDKQTVNRKLVGFIVTTLHFLIVVMLIYGAALRRASYILPFFCLQLFDFALTVLIAATSLIYSKQMKINIEAMPNQPHARCISEMNDNQFRLFLISAWFIIFVIKTYLLNVIWACFKHAKSTEARRTRTELTTPQLVFQGDMDTMALLPSYDDVVKTSPPPAYNE